MELDDDCGHNSGEYTDDDNEKRCRSCDAIIYDFENNEFERY